jgi:signal transduction histidine kinase
MEGTVDRGAGRARRGGQPVSLRAALRVAIGALVTMLLGTALALSLVTTFLHRAAVELGSALESVRVAQSLQIELMTHHRSTLVAAIDHEPSYVPAAWALEARVIHLLAEARAHAPTAAERALVARTGETITAYLEAQHEQAASGPPREAWLRALAPKFDAALTAVDTLVWFNVDAAHAWEGRAGRWDALADVASVVVAVLAVAGTVALVLGLRSRMFRAMADLHGAVRRFAAGDGAARAPVEGAREVREIAASFNGMADALNRHEQGMLVFLGGLARDLRDPLTAIKVLIRGAQGPTPTLAPGATPIIDRQVRRLERILRDVVDGTMIEAGKLELRRAPVDLRGLVREAVDAYRELAPEHRFALALPDEAVSAVVDRARIDHVLANLVSNAVKYSPVGSLVSVSLSATDHAAVLAVADAGVGIDGEDQARIFERYQRTGASRGLVAGAGLGLWATRQIVEAHGGALARIIHDGGEEAHGTVAPP